MKGHLQKNASAMNPDVRSSPMISYHCHQMRRKWLIVNKNNLHLCINRHMWLFLLVLLFCNWDYIKLLLAFSCSEQFLILFPAHVATTQGGDAWCVLTKCPEWLRYYLQCEWYWYMQGYIIYQMDPLIPGIHWCSPSLWKLWISQAQ